MNSPPPETDAEIREDRPLRILIVEPQNVVPANHGSGVRAWNLLRRLSGPGLTIDLLIFHGGTDDPAQRDALAPFCRRLMLEPFARSGDVTAPGTPDFALPYAAALSRERLRDLVRAHGYDIVQFDGWELGGLIQPDLAAPAIAVALDLGFMATARNAALERVSGDRARRRRREIPRQLAFERLAYRRSTSVQCMSKADADLLARRMPEVADRIAVVPNGVDTAELQPGGAARTEELLFLGSFPHPPNRDAAIHLVRDIWPRIRALRPATRLTLAGASPDDEILALGAADGVHVAGELEDVRGALAAHRLLVAPLRSGSGTRVKILEAFAAGIPVVSTTIGAEGLGARPGEHLLIADDPDRFAAETVRLLDDEAGRAALAAAARRFVEERFDWERSSIATRTDYRAVVARRPRLGSQIPSTVIGEGGTPPPDRPEVDLVVFGEPPRVDFVPLLEQFAAQELDWTVRLSFVIRGAHLGELIAADPPAGRVWTFEPEDGRGWPAALNDVLGDLTAPACLLLDAALLPRRSDWLANLSWSLLQPHAPGIVFGGIGDEAGDEAPVTSAGADGSGISTGSRRHPLATGRPRREARPAVPAGGGAWREPWTSAFDEIAGRSGGRLLDVRNCGFLRRTWEAFPIPERGLSGAIWQLQLARFGALVHFVDTAPARELAAPPRTPRVLLSEANAFARLGHRLDWREASAAARALGGASRGDRLRQLAALYAGARLPSHRVDRYARHQLY